MANHLKMVDVTAIQVLHEQGKSQREIARILRIHRETVGRYVDLLNGGGGLPTGQEGENRPNPPTGSVDQNQPNPPTGSALESRPNLPAGSSGPRSRGESFREVIIACLERGLSAQRVWQDLRTEHGFAGGYDSIKRFIRRLKAANPLPFRRMECEPGAEAQVDFGTGAPVVSCCCLGRSWAGRRAKTA